MLQLNIKPHCYTFSYNYLMSLVVITKHCIYKLLSLDNMLQCENTPSEDYYWNIRLNNNKRKSQPVSLGQA